MWQRFTLITLDTDLLSTAVLLYILGILDCESYSIVTINFT